MAVPRYIKKGIKIIGWTACSVIGLFLLLVLLIQVPIIQDVIRSKAVSYLEGKLHTPVRIGSIEIGLPKKIILEDIYLQSQSGDTLLAGKKIAVDISLFKLFDNEAEVNSVVLKNITANIIRDKDSVFNFDYIIDAFASHEGKTTEKEMKFSLHDITLDHIKVYFNDAVTENDLKVSLVHFDTHIKSFDLPKMYFDVPKINLDGLTVQLKQGQLVREIATKAIVTTDSLVHKRPDFDVKLKEVTLANIKVNYDNAGTRLNSGLSLEKLFITFDAVNLPKQQLAINEFELSGVKGALTLGKYNQPLKVNTLPPQKAPNWKLSLSHGVMKKIDFRFDDENAPRIARGIDYKHLNIQQLQLEAKRLKYRSDAFSGSVQSFAVMEKGGLNLEMLRTDFTYDPQGIQLKGLYAKTPQTLVRHSIGIRYPSLDTLKTDPGLVNIDVNLEQSRVGLNDVLLFAPDLIRTPFFKNHPNGVATINGRLTGQLKDLSFPNMEMGGIGGYRMLASGRIIGLPDAKKAWYDMNIRELRIGAADIRQSANPGDLPSSIEFPKQMMLKGTFKGKLNNFNTDLLLKSTFGNAKVKANFDYRTKNKEKYNGIAELDNFDVGQLIKNQTVGSISLKAKVNGRGLNPKTATATIAGVMSKGTFNNYTYRNFKLNGTIVNGRYNAKAGINDPNLQFDLASDGNFAGAYPQINMKLKVDIADLEKLKFRAEPLKLRGELDATIATADLEYLNGTVTAHHLLFATGKVQIPLDSVTIMAVSTAEKNTIELHSQFLKATMDGRYQLNHVMTALTHSIARYYDTDPSAKKKATVPQHFAFTADVINDPILNKLLPEIKQLEPININGRYNSVNDTIVLNASLPRIIYGETTISSAFLNITTVDGALVYKAGIDEAKNEQFRLAHTSLEGTVRDNALSYKLQARDDKKKDQYVIAGTLKSDNSSTEFHLIPKDLVLNYERWTLSENNLIRFGPKGIYVRDFVLGKEGSSLSLQSRSDAPNAPLLIRYTDFDIATVSRLVQQESLAMGGLLNGEAVLKDLNTRPIFTAALTINDFTFKKEKIGNISLKVNNETANTYAVQAALTGAGNQAALEGIYRNGNRSFDLTLAVQQLNLASIEPFTANQLSKCSGYVSGKFHIKGTADVPKIIGNLQFHNGAFTVTPLNSAFEQLNDEITFTEEGMEFKNFSLSDAEKNTLVLRGKLDTPNYRDFAFDLRINADNFKAINSTAKDNDLYYGKLFIDTHLRVKGDTNKPVVNGRIKVNKNSALTIVLPQSDPSIVDREGVVEFIDQDAPPVDKRFTVAADSLSQTKFKRMNASVTIEVDKEAELTLIVDKGNGDFLKIKGEAQLNGGVDESGKTTLTGRYELKEGTYEMTFNLLKRKFDIQEGSYILWTGEPTSADINITAVYKTKAAPIDLLDNQLGNVSQTVRNTYKQQIPFETLLKMKGELLKPEITFDIQLPEGTYSVSSEIVNTTRSKLDELRQHPDELNKQVFALLLLNRFVAENPFASAAGTGTEALARQSVSKILSQQLNNLAADLVKGVDIDMNLESTEDYTSGARENRTDLNVGVSKQLLSDRLKVTVGNSFGIEGSEQPNRDAVNIAGDVSLNYQLSKDGRYMMRGYRKNEYQVAFQGQVIETGVAFTITMDYNKFRELFHRTEEEKEMQNAIKKRKEQEKKDAKANEKEQEQTQSNDAKKR